jgi:hypothetical protein
MYIYIYIHIHIYIYIYIYNFSVFMIDGRYIYMNIYICIYIYTCIYISIYIYILHIRRIEFLEVEEGRQNCFLSILIFLLESLKIGVTLSSENNKMNSQVNFFFFFLDFK